MKNLQIWINFLLLHGIVFNVVIAPVLVAITIIQNQNIFTFNEWVYSIGINIFLWQLLSIHIREKKIAEKEITLFVEVKKNPIVQRIHNWMYTIFCLLNPGIYNFIISCTVFISLFIVISSFTNENNGLLFNIVEWVVFIQCWRILFIYQAYLSNQMQGIHANKMYTFWIIDLFLKKTN